MNKYLRFVCVHWLRYGLPSILIILLTISIASKLQYGSRTALSSSSSSPELPPTMHAPLEASSSFAQALASRASTDLFILLALTDLGFLDMTLNYYHGSIQKFDIKNYLFISADSTACQMLNDRDIACFVYQSESQVAKAAEYGTKEFILKMHIRTHMILDALKLGYNVIHSDVDIVFFDNPMSHIKTQCTGKCNIALMWDHVVYNAGFLLALPHPETIHLYEEMVAISKRQPKLDDQEGLNKVVKNLVQRHRLKVATLPKEKYVNGFEYFEKGKRMFDGDNPCSDCLVLHNNWIVSKAAKIYRFKEHGMWIQDDDYYTSTSNRYLTYNNLFEGVSREKDIVKHEANALRNALAIGRILNRIVILPEFHCKEKQLQFGRSCPLNALFRITSFDEVFANKYREHSFLKNPLVPKEITDSVKFSAIHVILANGSSEEQYANTDSGKSYKVHQPNDKAKGASKQEILTWFADNSDTVLHFHSLYNAFYEFPDKEENLSFAKNISKGLSPASYRQYAK